MPPVDPVAPLLSLFRTFAYFIFELIAQVRLYLSEFRVANVTLVMHFCEIR